MANRKSKRGRAETATAAADRDKKVDAGATPPQASEGEGRGGADAQGGPPALGPAPKVAPKLHAEPALGKDPVLEAAQSGYERLRENWQVLAAALLVIALAALVVNWRMESTRARNKLAWAQFSEATREATPSPERISELAGRFRGSTAEPFMLLTLGDLYARAGDRAGLDKAIQSYERVVSEFDSNEVAAEIARRSLETTKKELTFDPAKHAAEKGEKVEWASGEKTPEGASPSK